MYSDTKVITNEKDRPLNVFIEPCAFDVDVLPGETYTFTFTSTSKVEGAFEVEETESGINNGA